ncbi:MAG TPA: 50S ribosomal protein L32e [Candidatus Nanoarchaeia archaeon]|nr:50S ribosomal protein L32e [Candidatus Nanoarchaeia archaeon]
MKELLQIRKEMKERKPHFIRQDDHRRMRIQNQDKWRKPKGVHSKIRHAFKGRRKMPSPGYKSPVAVKGLHHSGLKMVHVATEKELAKVNKSSEGIIVSANLGMRRKLEILKKAKELGLTVLNFNSDDKIKKIEENVASRKKRASKKDAKKEAKSQKTEAKAEPKAEDSKKDSAESQSAEAKKDAEKEEKKRVLTKKE